MKRLMGFIMVLTLAAGLLAGLPQDSKDKQKGKDKQVPPPPPAKIYIPASVKTVMEGGLATREARQDIPFTVFKNFFFPASQNLHAVFLFKVKNIDLGFAPVAPPAPANPPAEAPKTAESKAQDQTPPPSPAGQTPPPPPADVLQAKVNIFLQFRLMENGAPGTVIREVYIPVLLEEKTATFNPDLEQWYSTGYPLAPGKYILSMAITSLDLMKIGVAYYEFAIFDRAETGNALEMSSLVLIDNNKLEMMEAPETTVTVHKGCFTYSKVRIVPKLENSIVAGENLQLFFFVFGASANDQQKNDLEFTYGVDQDGKPAIRWAPQTSDVSIVCQDLPMKQTVLVKDGKEERREQRNLPVGKYVLNIKMKDKITGNLGEKNVEFEVK